MQPSSGMRFGRTPPTVSDNPCKNARLILIIFYYQRSLITATRFEQFIVILRTIELAGFDDLEPVKL